MDDPHRQFYATCWISRFFIERCFPSRAGAARKAGGSVFLISHFGTVLSIRDKQVVQERLDQVGSIASLAVLRSDRSGLYLSAHGEPLYRLDTWTGTVGRGVVDSYFRIENDQDANIVALLSPRGYVRALADGSVDYTQQTVHDWERFHMVSEPEIAALLGIAGVGIVAGGVPHFFDASASSGRTLQFGSIRLSISEYLRNRSSFEESNEVMVFDDWSPSIHKIYNPVVLYLIFGTGYLLEQLACSLRSLSSFGRYRGTVMIATNNDPDLMRNLCAENGFDDVRILPVEAMDRLDFVGTRISLLADGILDHYTPILYVDADIVFDQDINPLLQQAVSLDRISAQFEEHNWLQLSPETGSSLYQQKPFPIEGTKGFCAGIMLVPSGRPFRKYFEAALHCLVTYTRQNGRDSIPFYDQSVLNYVLHKLGIVSPFPLTDRTRTWPLRDGEEPRGFVHFWDGREERHRRMRDYISELGQAQAEQQ